MFLDQKCSFSIQEETEHLFLHQLAVKIKQWSVMLSLTESKCRYLIMLRPDSATTFFLFNIDITEKH